MARRWAWLHAHLGGDGVLEVVAPVANRRGWSRLPPIAWLKLRTEDLELPLGEGIIPRLRLKADLGLPRWSVTGRLGPYRLSVEVFQPPERTLTVEYTDPDGSPVFCHNSETADAHIKLEKYLSGRWQTEMQWQLDRTAHAEVGQGWLTLECSQLQLHRLNGPL
jgi:hypothetical protein